MTPSPQQLVFFDWIESGSGSAILSAVAGSGKTTTIVEATKKIPPGKLAVVLAFNTKIADELKTRLPFRIQSSTFHRRCLDALRRSGPVTIDGEKCSKILRELVPQFKERMEVGGDVLKLVSLAKNAG